MSSTHIVIVPGIWEGPHVFDTVVGRLRQNGFNVTIAALPSTGKTNPPGTPESEQYTMDSDIVAIRQVVEQLVEQGKDVVMALHSAGGFLGSNAIEGLSKRARSAKGSAGGVVKFAMITAALPEEGYVHVDMPFMDIVGEKEFCKAPRDMLFNDILDDAEAAKHLESLSFQPAVGWNSTTTYCGWREVPSVYLICEKDKCVPKEFQTHFATAAGSEVLTCDAGHMPQITQPDKVVELISRAATVEAAV